MRIGARCRRARAHSAGHSTAHEVNVVGLFLRNLPRALSGEPLVNEWTPA